MVSGLTVPHYYVVVPASKTHFQQLIPSSCDLLWNWEGRLSHILASRDRAIDRRVGSEAVAAPERG